MSDKTEEIKRRRSARQFYNEELLPRFEVNDDQAKEFSKGELDGMLADWQSKTGFDVDPHTVFGFAYIDFMMVRDSDHPRHKDTQHLLALQKVVEALERILEVEDEGE